MLHWKQDICFQKNRVDIQMVQGQTHTTLVTLPVQRRKCVLSSGLILEMSVWFYGVILTAVQQGHGQDMHRYPSVECLPFKAGHKIWYSIHPGSSVFENTFYSSKAVTNEVAATEIKLLLIKDRGTIYHLCFIDYLTFNYLTNQIEKL